MYEALFDVVEAIAPLSDPLKERLCSCLQTQELKKKSCLLREGQTSNHIFFIKKGLVKSFYTKDGEDICSWFMKENDFIVAVNSFFTRKPSQEFIETLEDTIVYSIHYNHLQSLYKEFPEFNLVGRLVTERYYVLSEERLHGMRRLSAEARLKMFINAESDLFMRVPRKDIASYLGITTETLSRIISRKHSNKAL